MKINKTLCKIILSLILILICSSSLCYAEEPAEVSQKLGVGISVEGFKPNISIDENNDSPAINIIIKILDLMRILGIIAFVVAVALIGFNMVLGSASQKAEGQGKLVGLVIASVVLFGGSSIAKLIIEIAEGL